jgi:hypothetical protein
LSSSSLSPEEEEDCSALLKTAFLSLRVEIVEILLVLTESGGGGDAGDSSIAGSRTSLLSKP